MKEYNIFDSFENWYLTEEGMETVAETFELEEEWHVYTESEKEELAWKMKSDDEYFMIQNLEYMDENNKGEYYLVTGSVRGWRGSPRGGKVYGSFMEVLRSGDWDGWKIIEDSYGRVFVSLTDHDGGAYLEVRRLTNKGIERFENVMEGEINSYSELEKLENRNYSKNCRLRKMMGWIN